MKIYMNKIDTVKCLFLCVNVMTNQEIFVKLYIGDNMKTKKIAYGLLLCSFVFIIAGCLSTFLMSLKTDHQQVLKRMDEASLEYEAFSTNVSLFEDYRDELYTEVLENVYYDTMYDNNVSVKTKLVEYEKIVDEVELNTLELDKYCKNIYYPNAKVNSNCKNYKSIYEQVINYFVGDIKSYNININKYNEYQQSINSTLLLEEYKTKRNYIDYNGDKIFDGKEE